MLMADSEKVEKELSEQVELSKQEEMVIINCNWLSTKKYTSSCELHIEVIKINQIRKCNILCSIVIDDGKCDTEVGKDIEMAKDVFHKLSK